MKRSISLVLAALLLFLSLFVMTSCDTTLSVKSFPYTMGAYAVENERYIMIAPHIYDDTLIFDKENNTLHSFSRNYLDNDIFSGRARIYTSPYNTELVGNEVLEYVFAEILKYDVDTGEVASRTYYPTTLTYDIYGNELRHETSTTPLTEEEMKAYVDERTPESSAKEFGIHFANGPYDDLDKGDEKTESVELTEDQTAVYEYVEGIEKKYSGIGDYHCSHGNARYINGKLYFSLTLCNKKNWAGQRPVLDGIYASYVICYNKESKDFERIYESDKEELIISFNETTVATSNRKAIKLYDIQANKLKASVNYQDSANLYIINDFIMIQYLDVDSYDTVYKIIDLDGNVLCETIID